MSNTPLVKLLAKLQGEDVPAGLLEATIGFSSTVEASSVEQLASHREDILIAYFSRDKDTSENAEEHLDALKRVLKDKYGLAFGTSQLSQMYDVTVHEDHVTVNKNTIYPGTRRSLSPPQIAAIFSHSNDGLTPEQIAQETGRSLPTINRYLQLAETGNAPPPTSRTKPVPRSYRPRAGGAPPLPPGFSLRRYKLDLKC